MNLLNNKDEVEYQEKNTQKMMASKSEGSLINKKINVHMDEINKELDSL